MSQELKSGEIAYNIVRRFFDGKTKDGRAIPYDIIGFTQMEFNCSKFGTKLKIAIEEALFDKDRIISDLESSQEFMESEAYKFAISEGVNNSLQDEIRKLKEWIYKSHHHDGCSFSRVLPLGSTCNCGKSQVIESNYPIKANEDEIATLRKEKAELVDSIKLIETLTDQKTVLSVAKNVLAKVSGKKIG